MVIGNLEELTVERRYRVRSEGSPFLTGMQNVEMRMHLMAFMIMIRSEFYQKQTS